MSLPDKAGLSVTATYKIRKYAEGANPDIDAPFEIVERTETFIGEDAVRILQQLTGGEINASN